MEFCLPADVFIFCVGFYYARNPRIETEMNEIYSLAKLADDFGFK